MSIIQTKKVSYGKNNTFSVNVEIYDSVMEVVEKCRTREITDSSFNNMPTYVEEQDDPKWYGVKTYNEALDLMYDGWNEKVAELQTDVRKLKVTQNDKRITFKNDVYGFSPIVPLAILGVPNSMINSTYKPIKSKTISVYYDMSVNCGNTAEQIVSNGRKVIEAIVRLENCGYRINLFVIQSYQRDNNGDMLVVKVKSANQPLDLKRICFPTMHAAFFRVIGFDWYSKFPKGKYRWGYGQSLETCVRGAKNAHEIMRNLFGKESVLLLADSVQRNRVEYITKILKGEEIDD